MTRLLRRAAAVMAAAALASVAAAAPAAARLVEIQAHRGGPYVEGVPAFAENTMPAFRHAADEGFVLELDAKLTRDDVPVVIHDATLDRTTTCTGPVRALTAAELAARCRADVLGVPGNDAGLPTAPVDDPTVPVPTLADALALARDRHARVNLEIKNLPSDGDFDPSPGPAYAARILDAVDASRIPRSRVLIQSFWPANLDAAAQRGYETSLLSLAQTNAGAPDAARARGYDWVSPAWPFEAAHVSRAHALGLRVVPYTVDRDADLGAAAANGVDELITNDPVRAARVLADTGPPAPPMPAAPGAVQCAGTDAGRRLPAIEAYDPAPGAPRVFAMQFKQELRHVVSYATYRRKIECLIRRHVLPRLAPGRPNVVAFTEDVGLATVATGSRATAARAIARNRDLVPRCDGAGAPCATLAALAAVGAGYGPELAAYEARFPGLDPVSGTFVAATDTFARGWMQTFSDMARRYGIYILGSNDQAPFRESTDPAEIGLFADPDLPARPASVYVATSPKVYNEVFLWGPRDVRAAGPRPLRNVVATNRKVPLTPIEQQLGLSPGPSSGPDAVENLAPYALPGTQARIGFATSLPAFVYGAPADGADPCADVARFYMRCLDRLGANLVMQDEANPGKWASGGAEAGAWAPMAWMWSTWRAVADRAVSFAYNVTPHMVGNLVDLPFDGQTAITQRGLGAAGGAGCHYVGTGAFLDAIDPEYVTIGGETLGLRGFAGPKREFLALAPWVTPDGPRDDLRRTADALAPDGGGPQENDYLETAVVADLPFPPDPGRPSCAGSQEPGDGALGPLRGP